MQKQSKQKNQKKTHKQTNKKKTEKSENVGDFTPMFPFCVLWRCTFEVDILSLFKKKSKLIAGSLWHFS